MPDLPVLTTTLKDEAASHAFGRALAGILEAGDIVALDGPLGAGKSTVARAVIQTLMAQDVEVPSPTFTLVQTYDSPGGEIWHVDLYRIEQDSELDALGLEDAFGDAIVLIEWPDRLGDRLPQNSLRIEFETAESGGRVLTLSATATWVDRLETVFA